MFTHVKSVQVKAESLYLSEEWIEQRPRDTFPSICRETFTRETQIRAEVSGMFVCICVGAIVTRKNKTSQHVIQKTSIGLLWRMPLRMEIRRRNSRRIRVECLLEFGGNWNLIRGRTELPNQIIHSVNVVTENRFARDPQRISRALGRHQRITVTIAANPGTKP